MALQHIVTLAMFVVINNKITTLQDINTLGAGYIDCSTWQERRLSELEKQFGWDTDPWYEGAASFYTAGRLFSLNL